MADMVPTLQLLLSLERREQLVELVELFWGRLPVMSYSYGELLMLRRLLETWLGFGEVEE